MLKLTQRGYEMMLDLTHPTEPSWYCEKSNSKKEKLQEWLTNNQHAKEHK